MLYAVRKWILNLIATLNLVDKNANFTLKLRHYGASAVPAVLLYCTRTRVHNTSAVIARHYLFKGVEQRGPLDLTYYVKRIDLQI